MKRRFPEIFAEALRESSFLAATFDSAHRELDAQIRAAGLHIENFLSPRDAFLAAFGAAFATLRGQVVLLHSIFELRELCQMLEEFPRQGNVLTICFAEHSVREAQAVFSEIRETHDLSGFAEALAELNPLQMLGFNLILISPDGLNEKLFSRGSAPDLIRPFCKPQFDLAVLDQLARRLNECDAIGILLGLGARGLDEKIDALAERLDALIFTTPLAKGLFAEEHPRFVCNHWGEGAPRDFHKLMRHLDGLIVLGARFHHEMEGFADFLPKTILHVDVDAASFDRGLSGLLPVVAPVEDVVTALIASENLQKKSTKTPRLVEVATAHREIQNETKIWRQKRNPLALSEAFAQISQVKCEDENIWWICDDPLLSFLVSESSRWPKSQKFLGTTDRLSCDFVLPCAQGILKTDMSTKIIAVSSEEKILKGASRMMRKFLPGDAVTLVVVREIFPEPLFKIDALKKLLEDKGFTVITATTSAQMSALPKVLQEFADRPLALIVEIAQAVEEIRHAVSAKAVTTFRQRLRKFGWSVKQKWK